MWKNIQGSILLFIGKNRYKDGAGRRGGGGPIRCLAVSPAGHVLGQRNCLPSQCGEHLFGILPEVLASPKCHDVLDRRGGFWDEPASVSSVIPVGVLPGCLITPMRRFLRMCNAAKSVLGQ